VATLGQAGNDKLMVLVDTGFCPNTTTSTFLYEMIERKDREK
jgi:hypothetical protein